MLLDMDEDEVPVMGLDDTSFFIPAKKIARVIPTNPTRKAPECCTQAFVLGVASEEGSMKAQVSRNGLPAACRVVDVGANAFVEVVADPRTRIRASAQVAVLNTATGVVQLDTKASNRIGLYGEWGGKVLDAHDPLDVVFVQMSDPNSTVTKGMRYLVPVDFEDPAAGQDTPNVFWWTSSYEDEGCLAASKSLVSLPCRTPQKPTYAVTETASTCCLKMAHTAQSAATRAGENATKTTPTTSTTTQDGHTALR
jgi:hypothetical protein